MQLDLMKKGIDLRPIYSNDLDHPSLWNVCRLVGFAGSLDHIVLCNIGRSSFCTLPNFETCSLLSFERGLANSSRFLLDEEWALSVDVLLGFWMCSFAHGATNTPAFFLIFELNLQLSLWLAQSSLWCSGQQ